MKIQRVLLFTMALLFERCAQVGPLGGGKRDTDPPVLTDAIPSNHTVNFNSGEIILKFDEFVQLKELNNQLIISPKIKTAPEITSEGRNIRISIKKEELHPGTTYRFYFGKAIADMHESNSLPDFEYVFSTGPNIDTLKISGTVTEAASNQPVGNVLVGLYPINSSDSIAWQETPDYFTRSSENGSFSLKNIPPATFKVIGINDKNKNGLYDGETEKIAFLDESLHLQNDSNIRLRLFQEEMPKVFLRKTINPYYGLTQLVLNKKTSPSIKTVVPSEAEMVYENQKGAEKDTISVYYKELKDTLGLLLSYPGHTDTLNIQLPQQKILKRTHRSFQLNTRNNNIPLGLPLVISFPVWMDTSLTFVERMTLADTEDTAHALLPVSGHWLNIREFAVDAKLAEGHNYQLKADTGAFYDFRETGTDSSRINFRVQSRLDFGKVTLNVKLNRKQSYIIQLINDQLQVIKEAYTEFSLSSSNAVSIDFTDVPPGTYQTRIIFDDNRNKKWDTGNLLRKIQPEKTVINSKQLKVLSDWEIEEEIVIRE